MFNKGFSVSAKLCLLFRSLISFEKEISRIALDVEFNMGIGMDGELSHKHSPSQR